MQHANIHKWLSCRVLPGQFSDEYAVEGMLFNDKPFSLFVNQDFVRPADDPTSNRQGVDGFIQIDILETNDDLALIGLPAKTLENGYTVTVKLQQIRENPA